MEFKAEKDKLKDFVLRDQLFGSYGNNEFRCVICEYSVLKKEAMFIVYNNGEELLKVSDLDIAIDKFDAIV